MNYTVSSKSLLLNLRWFLVVIFIAIISFLLLDLRAAVGILFIGLVATLPQVYLALSYEKAIRYKNVIVDYENEKFIFQNKSAIEKEFQELKSFQYHKTLVPAGYLSLALNLCEHFYYYKLVFKDGSVFYLPCLLDPAPNFEPQGRFYPYYFEVTRTFAYIK